MLHLKIRILNNSAYFQIIVVCNAPFRDILKMLVKFDAEIINFKAECEDLVKKSCVSYNKIDQLKDELKSKDHIINKLLTTIGDLTRSELKFTDTIIHKLINQSNCEENTNRTSINQSSTKITSNNSQGKNVINDSHKIDSVNAIKKQVATLKENSTLVKPNKQRNGKSKNQISKATLAKKSHIKITGDFILNGIHERYEQR